MQTIVQWYVPPVRQWRAPEVEKHCLGQSAAHLQLLADLAPKAPENMRIFAYFIKFGHLWKVFGGYIEVQLTIHKDLPA